MQIENNIDEDVILQYKVVRDNELLNPLFKKYSKSLFGLAYYYLNDRDRAMDVVMDVFETVLKTVAEKEITYFKGWIMSICRNICLKRLRDHKSYAELTDLTESFVESEEEEVYSDQKIDKLLEYIKDLQDNQRICIEAFYLNGMSYTDIASNYEYSLNEVKSYIQNGKRNLTLMFERKK